MSSRDATASASTVVNSTLGDRVAAPLYRTLTDHASVGLWHIEADGRTIYANPAMLVLMEVGSLEEVRNAHFTEFFTERGIEIVRAEQLKRAKGLASSYEVSFVGRKQTVHETIVSGAPLLAADGKLVGMVGSFLDVTELRKAERALKDSQAMLRAAMESLPFDFWAIGPDGRYCLLNTSARKRWGDQIGKRPEEVGVSPDVLATWIENNRRARAGHLVRGEVTYRDGDEVRHADSILAPIRDGNEVRGLLGVNIDITARKVAERARREAHGRLQSFLDHSTAVVFLKDAVGKYVLVNRQFERSFGIPRERALGRCDADLFTPEHAAQYIANDVKVRESGEEMEFDEITHYTRGVRTNLVLKFPVRDDSGAIIGIGGVATDITERRSAEEARRQADERYRVLVDTARDVILTFDPEGVITSVNPACEIISGWKQSDWIGRFYGPLIIEEDRALAFERFRDALNGKQTPPYELRAHRKDGSQMTVEVTLTPITENGKVASCLGIARDVTERRQLETQLRQVQKMESIGQLAGGVAHDFNNILTVIQGHAALVQSTENLPAEVVDSIEQISQAAERAANLTRQLLAFSRRQLLRPRPVDLNEVVADMSKMLRRIVGEDIAVQVHADSTIPQVLGDPGMVEQVLLNLAVNARDAMSGGGRLAISTDSFRVLPSDPLPHPDASPGQWVRLTVSDTGCGIEPADLPRIFEPFFTTKGVGRGTGLGLATVYGIVHQHHGWITVDSHPGRGSSFRVNLPAKQAAPVEPLPAEPVPIPSRGTERILVVEDETAVRNLVCGVLGRLGYQVLEAHSGAAALEKWQLHHGSIDLVLTDIVMPDGMTGRQLAEWLETDQPNLPIIYTSGYAAEAVSGDFPLREGDNFLQKPYPPQRLADLIRRKLDEAKARYL